MGIGTDLVEVAHMASILGRPSRKRFLERVFCPNEIDESKLNYEQPFQFYAGRFAAKEAFVKAIGTGFSQGITPRMICVKRARYGKPEIILEDTALLTAQEMGVVSIHLSITHTKKTACAFVVLENESERVNRKRCAREVSA